MSEPLYRELPGGHRAQIVPARELRAGDRLAYRGRGRGTVLWLPVGEVAPAGAMSVRVAVDDGEGYALGRYAWSTRRATTAIAIAPRRVYLASVMVDDPGGSSYLLEDTTVPDAAAAATWLQSTLERSPEREKHRLSGYAHPGEWITHDYRLEDREFAYDEDDSRDEPLVFIADAAGVTQTGGPRA